MGLAWDGNSRTFADTLLGVYLSAILHCVNCKVNFGQRPLLLDGANGIVDLLVSTVVVTAGIPFGVHIGSRDV